MELSCLVFLILDFNRLIYLEDLNVNDWNTALHVIFNIFRYYKFIIGNFRGHGRMTFNMFKNLKVKILFVFLLSPFVFADEPIPIVIDVRTLEEVKTGVIQDAIHIEWTKIEEKIIDLNIAKDQKIYLYCRSGNR